MDMQVAQTIIDGEKAALWYHPTFKIVHHEFRVPVRGPELRDVLTKGVEVFEKQGAHKWLSDDRGNGPLHVDDADWAVNVWQPRVMAAGWKAWAIVMPVKILGQMNMRRWSERYSSQGVTVQAFTEPDEAMKWLEVQ